MHVDLDENAPGWEGILIKNGWTHTWEKDVLWGETMMTMHVDLNENAPDWEDILIKNGWTHT